MTYGAIEDNTTAVGEENTYTAINAYYLLDNGTSISAGYEWGDDGSAAKLGRELLRYSILCHENLERHSDLTVAIMDSYQNKIVNVVKRAIDFKPTDFGQFAPILFEYYHKKDPIAIKIINSEIPLLGPDANILMSLAILFNDTAICLRAP